MTPIVFTLPRPFSANAMYVRAVNRVGAGKRIGDRVHTTEYSAWFMEMGWLINVQRGEREKITGAVIVRIEIPKSSKLDVDNCNKPILDLLQRMRIIANDRQVDDLHTRRTERGDVLIEITEVK